MNLQEKIRVVFVALAVMLVVVFLGTMTAQQAFGADETQCETITPPLVSSLLKWQDRLAELVPIMAAKREAYIAKAGGRSKYEQTLLQQSLEGCYEIGYQQFYENGRAVIDHTKEIVEEIEYQQFLDWKAKQAD